VKFSTATHSAKGILNYVHKDVGGHTKMTFIRGSEYFMSFIDDYSRRY